jgi:hypothetical protein
MQIEQGTFLLRFLQRLKSLATKPLEKNTLILVSEMREWLSLKNGMEGVSGGNPKQKMQRMLIEIKFITGNRVGISITQSLVAKQRYSRCVVGRTGLEPATFGS